MDVMKTLIATIVSILIAALSWGCDCAHSRSKAKAVAAAISVTDFRGKKIELQKPCSRAVCLIESTLSGIYMLHAEDAVIGIPSNVYSGDVFRHYAVLDRRIKEIKLPAPGNWDFVSIESVLL